MKTVDGVDYPHISIDLSRISSAEVRANRENPRILFSISESRKPVTAKTSFWRRVGVKLGICGPIVLGLSVIPGAIL